MVMLKLIFRLIKAVNFLMGAAIFGVMCIGIAHNLDDGPSLMIAFAVLSLAAFLGLLKRHIFN
jgi:hypothetical protein